MKPKQRTRVKTPKPKKVVKTLDLTINDAEVEKIVSGNEYKDTNKIQSKPTDAKLNAFLEALQKKI